MKKQDGQYINTDAALMLVAALIVGFHLFNIIFPDFDWSLSQSKYQLAKHMQHETCPELGPHIAEAIKNDGRIDITEYSQLRNQCDDYFMSTDDDR
jgi:hypothetical protein